MKKLILSLSFTAVALALVFTSCQKEEINTKEIKSKTINTNDNSTEKVSIVVGIKIVWDEWGRANHNCRKAGLCNIRIETIEIELGFGKSAPIIIGENEEMYIEVLVDSDLDFGNSSTNFYIDNDIFAEHGDDVYKVESGVFEIDYSLGPLGGYTIPIVKQ